MLMPIRKAPEAQEVEFSKMVSEGILGIFSTLIYRLRDPRRRAEQAGASRATGCSHSL